MQRYLLKLTQRAHGHEPPPRQELTPRMFRMFQGSRLLPSEPQALENRAICQEAMYLSSWLVGVKSDKTMLSGAVFTVVIGVKETPTGSTFIYQNCQ